ncbi:methyltransferase domain-containing protein [Paenibacillus aurantiacus]|uniref:Methyltransferase domain-containing protein n=1 Tax=Paenibacillus aurantiacus TaxID=1936118 RepID=A0ABV5KMH2_9BACL
MKTIHKLHADLGDFAHQFADLSCDYNRALHHSNELERLIDWYSAWITDADNQSAWERLTEQEPGELDRLATAVRRDSARCVAMLEKVRAVRLLQGETTAAAYFSDIEARIEEEFGRFRVTSASKVLLVGSGAFPMTPLYIARQTGAQVVGIDIDEEAIELGRSVIAKLGAALPILLERASLEELDFTAEATHVIFSSTVGLKYELLDRLHALTKDAVVVAMRYGDGFKSLFNYPMENVDTGRWRLAECLKRPDRVFDIALYLKASAYGREDKET